MAAPISSRVHRTVGRGGFAFGPVSALAASTLAFCTKQNANRITVLALRPPAEKPDEAAFQKLHATVVETITPGFAAGLVSRSVRLLPG